MYMRVQPQVVHLCLWTRLWTPLKKLSRFGTKCERYSEAQMENGVLKRIYDVIFSKNKFAMIRFEELMRRDDLDYAVRLTQSNLSKSWVLMDFNHVPKFRNSSPLLTTKTTFTYPFIAYNQNKRAGNLRHAYRTLKISKHAWRRGVAALTQLERNWKDAEFSAWVQEPIAAWRHLWHKFRSEFYLLDYTPQIVAEDNCLVSFNRNWCSVFTYSSFT